MTVFRQESIPGIMKPIPEIYSAEMSAMSIHKDDTRQYLLSKWVAFVWEVLEAEDRCGTPPQQSIYQMSSA